MDGVEDNTVDIINITDARINVVDVGKYYSKIYTVLFTAAVRHRTFKYKLNPHALDIELPRHSAAKPFNPSR